MRDSADFYERLEDSRVESSDPDPRKFRPAPEGAPLAELNRQFKHAMRWERNARLPEDRAAWTEIKKTADARYLAAWKSPEYADQVAAIKNRDSANLSNSRNK